jgi:hypothetical protein
VTLWLVRPLLVIVCGVDVDDAGRVGTRDCPRGALASSISTECAVAVTCGGGRGDRECSLGEVVGTVTAFR